MSFCTESDASLSASFTAPRGSITCGQNKKRMFLKLTVVTAGHGEKRRRNYKYDSYTLCVSPPHHPGVSLSCVFSHLLRDHGLDLQQSATKCACRHPILFPLCDLFQHPKRWSQIRVTETMTGTVVAPIIVSPVHKRAIICSTQSTIRALLFDEKCRS